jgi:hypothetical protein
MSEVVDAFVDRSVLSTRPKRQDLLPIDQGMQHQPARDTVTSEALREISDQPVPPFSREPPYDRALGGSTSIRTANTSADYASKGRH